MCVSFHFSFQSLSLLIFGVFNILDGGEMVHFWGVNASNMGGKRYTHGGEMCQNRGGEMC